jgi:Skp family chaperone for outer membrane proteins
MKRNFIIPAVLALLTVVAMSVSAQPRPGPSGAASPKPAAPQPTRVASATVPDAKIAFVDTTAFGDEKTGIKRFVNAVKTVQLQFQPTTAALLNLQNRIKTIADEITKLNGNPIVDPKTIQAKQDEGERLQRELKYKKEDADTTFEKKYTEVVGPVSHDIGIALDQYLLSHGLTVILDISKLAPAVLTVNPATDITQAFIADYNSKHP